MFRFGDSEKAVSFIQARTSEFSSFSAVMCNLKLTKVEFRKDGVETSEKNFVVPSHTHVKRSYLSGKRRKPHDSNSGRTLGPIAWTNEETGPT